MGSELRGDDAVAMRVASLLGEYRPRRTLFELFVGGTAPENATGPMRRFRPSHLLVLDAADLGQPPGTIELLERSRLSGISFCTHALPLSVIIDYVLASCAGSQAIVVGIQPGHLTMDRPMSPEVVAAADAVATTIRAALG